ncbi:MAG TPA: hypothetical protein PLJ38_08225, partial [bacterium]|nr:hypothetical protein [bacterium]
SRCDVQLMMKSKKKFRIAFIQLTGYLKPSELQLYSYTDTDERLIYCYELAKTFANDGMNVDIFTRLINEEGKENFDYSRREQQSADANLKIIRINCGPTNKFINQTKIWRYINEFANNIVNYISLNRVNIEFFITTTPESTAAALLIKKKLKIPYIYLATSFLFDNFFDKKITKTSIDSQFKKNKWHIFYEIEKNILKYSDVLVLPNYLNFEKLSSNIFYRKILNSKNLNIQKINTGIFSEKIEEVKNASANIEYLTSLIIPQMPEDRANLPCILTDFKNKKISADNINNLLKLYDKSELLKNQTNIIIVTLNSCDKKTNYDDLKKLLNKYNKTRGIYIVLLKDYLKEIYYIFDYFKKKGSVYFHYSTDDYNIGNSI